MKTIISFFLASFFSFSMFSQCGITTENHIIVNSGNNTAMLPIDVSSGLPGATIQQPEDVDFLWLKLAHPSMGKIEISLICPNGQAVITHDNGGLSHDLGFYTNPYFGEDLGVAWDYWWAADATRGTLTEEIDEDFLYPGIYSSDQSFTNLVGCPVNGQWTAKVKLSSPYPRGDIFGWGVGFDQNLMSNPCSGSTVTPTQFGCTNPTACNYDPISEVDFPGACYPPINGVHSCDVIEMPVNDPEVCKTSSLQVSSGQNGEIIENGGQVTFWLNAYYSDISSSDVTLECPNGQTAMLSVNGGPDFFQPGLGSDNLGAVLGTGYTYTLKDSAEMDEWWSYGMTFSDLPPGEYKPAFSFDSLVGCPVNGTWTLRFCDSNLLRDGKIFGWGFEISPYVAPPPPVEGCTIAFACNYNPEAEINDGSCLFPGCHDPLACNYTPNLCEGGTCHYDTGCYGVELYYYITPQNCNLTTMDIDVQEIYPEWVNSITLDFYSLDGLHDSFLILYPFSSYTVAFEYPGYVSLDMYTSPQGGLLNIGIQEIVILGEFEPIIETFPGGATCTNCLLGGPVYWQYTTFDEPGNWQEFWNTSEPNEFIMSNDVESYQVCVRSLEEGCVVCSGVLTTSVSNYSRKEDFLIFDNGSEQPTIRLSHPGKIEIFSMEGKLVEVIQGKEILPNLAKGLYVVKSGTYTKKLVIG